MTTSAPTDTISPGVSPHVATQQAIITRTVSDLLDHGHIEPALEAVAAGMRQSVKSKPDQDAMLDVLMAEIDNLETEEIADHVIELLNVLRARGVPLPPEGSFDDEIREALDVLAHTKPRGQPRAAGAPAGEPQSATNTPVLS